MKLTAAIISTGTGAAPAVAQSWVDPLNVACALFGIDQTPERMASFLANVGVESAGLTQFAEGLYYSDPKRLAIVWPTRFAINPAAVNKVPNSDAYRYVGKPQDLANFVYADRLGNGSVASGDGWKFRGQGPIQMTGRTNYMKFFAAANLPLSTDPTTLQQPSNGAASAAWFYAKNCAAFAAIDGGSFDLTVKAVNGALPGPANNGDLRRSRYSAVLAALKAQADAPAPAAPAPKAVATPKAPAKTPAASQ